MNVKQKKKRLIEGSVELNHILVFVMFSSPLLFCPSPSQGCKALDIQFHLLHGTAVEVLPGFVSDRSLGAVVTDFWPLREPLQWLEGVEKGLPDDIPFIQVLTLHFLRFSQLGKNGFEARKRDTIDLLFVI